MSYYLSKVFVILAHNYQSLEKVPIKFKQCIHDVNIFDSDYVMTYNSAIPSVANTLKKIHLSKIIFNEFTSTYYDNIDYCFSMLFQQYAAGSVNNINQPSLIK